MEIIGSLCALAVLAVPMLVIALLIFLQDFHNPFFRQVRVTKDGRYFYMYMFRTMCVDAEQKLDALKQRNEADGPVFKMSTLMFTAKAPGHVCATAIRSRKSLRSIHL